MSVLKVNSTLCSMYFYLFWFFYSLVPEIEIRLKYFLEKSPKEQPMYYLSRGETTPVICF